ncbi:SDR family NAD(P)-dependent oxidoreductase [uncultured Aeromicrobium sp.]|uniref:SDR family NAD(P)-dependent oxidoreductase n=1 Tax=uncultured Aeromicrobium sp. TaxID=337820 RepID=UPI0025E17D07|nr:SDR family oxidoreductase [uncultured Aeromicrobium sp.]
MNATNGRLDGKTIWLTGAGKGLGRAIGDALIDEGAIVVATARSVENLEEFASSRRQGRVIVAPGSVTDAATVAAIAADIAARGPIHGLVNCAGISPSFERSERVSLDVVEQVLATNVIGTFNCCQAAGRLMLDSGGGSIVNIGSVHASVGYPRIAAYAASKGAVQALTRTLAVEWADRAIRVNTLTPGYYPTELSEGLLASTWGQDIIRRIPMGRTGDPAELGTAAVFLLSDDSSYMTGADITIDGGWQAW